MNICTKCNERHIPWYSCQSWHDTRVADGVLSKHSGKKFCDRHQICSKCCSIKHIIRTLNHLSGRCKRNRNRNKCHICYDATNGRSLPYLETYARRDLNNQILKLYKHFLGIK